MQFLRLLRRAVWRRVERDVHLPPHVTRHEKEKYAEPCQQDDAQKNENLFPHRKRPPVVSKVKCRRDCPRKIASTKEETKPTASKTEVGPRLIRPNLDTLAPVRQYPPDGGLPF